MFKFWFSSLAQNSIFFFYSVWQYLYIQRIQTRKNYLPLPRVAHLSPFKFPQIFATVSQYVTIRWIHNNKVHDDSSTNPAYSIVIYDDSTRQCITSCSWPPLYISNISPCILQGSCIETDGSFYIGPMWPRVGPCSSHQVISSTCRSRPSVVIQICHGRFLWCRMWSWN